MNFHRAIMKAWADSFRYLSACFCLPQKELFIQENVLCSLVQALTETCPKAVPFSKEMEKAFKEQDEERLRVDFAKLFIGPYELLAPPYGSVYLEGERRLMGNSTVEVIKLYQEAGLVMDKDLKELPDHIAVELEFMYYLIWKETEALEKSETEKAHRFREMRDKFFHQLLSPWVPSFCQRIKESTDNFFYIALANCLSTFIANQSLS